MNDWQLRKLKQSEERKRKTKLERTEAEIERLEGELDSLKDELASEEVQSDYEKLIALSSAMEAAQNELDALYETWEELQDE